MIVIRSKHDIQTAYLYAYSQEVVDEARAKGFKVALIEGDEICEATLRSRLKKSKAGCIFFNGHGTSDALYNTKLQQFIGISTADVFQGTVAYTVACSCLNGLGEAAVNKKCTAFIGYDRPFWIAREHKSESRPLDDNVAKPIIECSNLVVTALVKGHTVQEAVDKSHEKAAENILKLIYSKEPLAQASLRALVSNDSALGFKGAAEAKIV